MPKPKYEPVDLWEILSDEGLFKINKNEVLIFQTPGGVKTSIKVVTCDPKKGYRGIIIPDLVDAKDFTEDQHAEIHDSIVDAASKKINKKR